MCVSGGGGGGHQSTQAQAGQDIQPRSSVLWMHLDLSRKWVLTGPATQAKPANGEKRNKGGGQRTHEFVLNFVVTCLWAVCVSPGGNTGNVSAGRGGGGGGIVVGESGMSNPPL